MLASWVADLSTILSIVGFAISIWLLIMAKDIRKSFLRRARLPEVIKELNSASKKLSEHLKNWTTDEKEVIMQLSISKALLENLIPKVPEAEQKKCKDFINTMAPKKFYIFSSQFSKVTEDQAWVLYTLLSEVTTMLTQLAKDSKWD